MQPAGVYMLVMLFLPEKVLYRQMIMGSVLGNIESLMVFLILADPVYLKRMTSSLSRDLNLVSTSRFISHCLIFFINQYYPHCGFESKYAFHHVAYHVQEITTMLLANLYVYHLLGQTYYRLK